MNMMMNIFHTLITVGVMFVYLDDLLIATSDIDVHFNTLRAVFSLAQQNDLSFERCKCEFLQLEVQFLGYTIAPNAFQRGRRLADAIQSIRTPTNKAKVTN